MALSNISLAVVGADYPNKTGPGRRFEIAMCEPGEPVELIPEPENPADANAIAVYSARGIQIGYVTAERAPWIGTQIRRSTDIIAIFQETASYGAVVRVSFDGAQPALPTPRESVDPEPDWWPDEEWPD